MARLGALSELQVTGVDVHTPELQFLAGLKQCDVIVHLAGMNRHKDPLEFRRVNRDVTRDMCERLREFGRSPRIVFSSSTQANQENPYGVSKREAEEVLLQFGVETGATIRICRLKNAFGKWCRPNYNSVVATFCCNIANDLPIQIADPCRELDLIYVDDIVDALIVELRNNVGSGALSDIPSTRITLGELAGRIQSFHHMRTNLLTPDFAVRFNQQLYATYLSYASDESRRQYLEIKSDHRGCLAEFIKSNHFGQIFVSRTRPGVTRGNHYHHTKTEKFFVVEGQGTIRMRQIESSEVTEYRVSGGGFQVIDIPPGFTHSIENSGPGELVTLFWASEILDPDRPDTYFLPVLSDAENSVQVTE